MKPGASFFGIGPPSDVSFLKILRLPTKRFYYTIIKCSIYKQMHKMKLGCATLAPESLFQQTW